MWYALMLSKCCHPFRATWLPVLVNLSRHLKTKMESSKRFRPHGRHTASSTHGSATRFTAARLFGCKMLNLHRHAHNIPQDSQYDLSILLIQQGRSELKRYQTAKSTPVVVRYSTFPKSRDAQQLSLHLPDNSFAKQLLDLQAVIRTTLEALSLQCRSHSICSCICMTTVLPRNPRGPWQSSGPFWKPFQSNVGATASVAAHTWCQSPRDAFDALSVQCWSHSIGSCMSMVAVIKGRF